MPRVRHGHKYSFNTSGLLASRIEKRVRSKQRWHPEYTRSDFFIEACIAKLTDWEGDDTPEEAKLAFMLQAECVRLEKMITKLEDIIDGRSTD